MRTARKQASCGNSRWCLVALTVSALLGACVESSAVQCDNGILCPAGNLCDPFGGGCVLPQQREACEPLADGESCSFAGVPQGVCRGRLCVSVACGNGIIELAEVCDDHNNLGGDGCSADCRSSEACGNGIVDRDAGEQCDDGNTLSADTCQATCQVPRCGDAIIDVGAGEKCDDGASNGDAANVACRSNCQQAFCGDGFVDTNQGEVCDDGNAVATDSCTPDCSSVGVCGNAYLDFLKGEQCDDGNLVSHDGCDSVCGAETDVWTAEATNTPLPARCNHGAVYDPVRSELVVFGGGCNVYRRDTWAWDGAQWVEQTTSGGPVARVGATMEYDAYRDRTLLFGGDAGGFHGDTWQWDGLEWTRRMPSMSPVAGTARASAYDAVRHRIVVFGGAVSIWPTTFKNETWEWTGDDWEKKPPATTSPGVRAGASMFYDPTRGTVVLFGGYTEQSFTNYTFFGDTWEWDGVDWTALAPGNAPSPRSGHDIAYDPVRRRAVLFGGLISDDPNPEVRSAETWEWDGSTWNQRFPTTSPSPRSEHTLSYDQVRKRIVLVGGYNGTNGMNDVWEWDGVDWKLRTTTNPSARLRHAATYDAARGKIVMFGGASGTSGGTRANDTWEWDGLEWRSITASSPPQARDGAVLAYDARRGTSLLFGGQTPSLLADTWVYNGSAGTWTNATPGASPTPRVGAGLAYDAARDRMVLFGGQAGGRLNDTWEWDGTTWAPITPIGASPPPRRDMGIAYDAARGEVVVFGGMGEPYGDSCRADTWVWNGSMWLDKTLAFGPTPRCSPVLSYDPIKRKVVMFGGWNHQDFNDSWEWDGTSWVDVTPPVAPPGRAYHTVVFDARRGEHVVFGGARVVYPPSNLQLPHHGDTWTLGSRSSALDESCTMGYDTDRDGRIGCNDQDCLGYCDPLCASASLCTLVSRPRCGDGTCGPLETYRMCPADCTLTFACGDYVCDPGETACPGDCSP